MRTALSFNKDQTISLVYSVNLTVLLIYQNPLRLSIAYNLQLVVGLYPVKVLAADYQILYIFKHSRLVLFHTYVVVIKALTASQTIQILLKRGYFTLTTLCFMREVLQPLVSAGVGILPSS